MRLGSYVRALCYLHRASQLVEQLRNQGLSPEQRLRWMPQYLEIYENRLICHMRRRTVPTVARVGEALAVSERLRSRLLLELAQVGEPAAAFRRLLFREWAIADQLHHLQSQRASSNTRTDADPNSGDDNSEQIAQLQRERAQIRHALAQEFQASNLRLPVVEPLTRREILRLARDTGITLLIFQATREGTFAFLVYPNWEYEAFEFPEFTVNRLTQLASDWVANYRERNAEEWRSRMESRLRTLYEDLMKPIHLHLREWIGVGGSPLLIVPSRALSLFALHACWWVENGERRYLIDEFEIRYAPSLTMFQFLWEREERRSSTPMHERTLQVVSGGTQFADAERRLIAARWGGCQELSEWQALVNNAPAAHLLHIAGHGQYNLDQPLRSTLQVSGEAWELWQILGSLSLGNAWLVVLSACETAFGDPKEMTEEQVNLCAAPLYAGASTVWGTLWRVEDLPTCLLMGKAYELLRAGRSKAAALREAALWLRTLTAEQVAESLRALSDQPNDLYANTARGYEEIANENAGPLFKSPYYWAAFQCIGV